MDSKENLIQNGKTKCSMLYQSGQKNIHRSSKRKLLISPSKDLMIFFGQSKFTNFITVKQKEKDKNKAKLTLNRNQTQKQKNIQSKLASNPQSNHKKIRTITNSTAQSTSNRKINSQQERFKILKKEVDQIRRKYSQKKLQKSLDMGCLKNRNNVGFSKNCLQNNSSMSLNESRQNICYLTPKNDRNLGKKILTKNMFSQKNRKLNLTLSKFVKPTNNANKLLIERKNERKSQPKDIPQSINISQQIQNSNKKTFQFTFGSMAMMDWNTKENHIPQQKIQRLVF